MGSSWTTTYSFKIDSWVFWDNTWWESQICSCSQLGAVICASGSCAQECHWWHSGKESACQCRGYRRHGFDAGKTPWNRKWQPIPVFLPEKSHEQRSLEGYSPWCHKESDTTEVLNTHIHRKLCSHEHAVHIHTHLNQSQLGFRSTPESCFTVFNIIFTKMLRKLEKEYQYSNIKKKLHLSVVKILFTDEILGAFTLKAITRLFYHTSNTGQSCSECKKR